MKSMSDVSIVVREQLQVVVPQNHDTTITPPTSKKRTIGPFCPSTPNSLSTTTTSTTTDTLLSSPQSAKSRKPGQPRIPLSFQLVFLASNRDLVDEKLTSNPTCESVPYIPAQTPQPALKSHGVVQGSTELPEGQHRRVARYRFFRGNKKHVDRQPYNDSEIRNNVATYKKNETGSSKYSSWFGFRRRHRQPPVRTQEKYYSPHQLDIACPYRENEQELRRDGIGQVDDDKDSSNGVLNGKHFFGASTLRNQTERMKKTFAIIGQLRLRRKTDIVTIVDKCRSTYDDQGKSIKNCGSATMFMKSIVCDNITDGKNVVDETKTFNDVTTFSVKDETTKSSIGPYHTQHHPQSDSVLDVINEVHIQVDVISVCLLE
jgi:hypothetical protein